MDNVIDVEMLINNIDDYIIIDLRSPLEYEEDTIKGAINIPLLDNEARRLVGTLYKHNQEAAYRQGLKIGSDMLPKIYEEVYKLKQENEDKKIVFFCFRGGTRSKSVHTMINMLGLESYRLNGGYKAYRRYIFNNLPNYLNQVNWLVLTGNTGVGKTIILEELSKEGYPVIDLENLACNRGSIFGEIGLDGIVNQKIFEGKLFFELKKYIFQDKLNIFIESESKRIGKVILPDVMYQKMKESPHLWLESSIEKRIEIIMETYQPEKLDKLYINKLLYNNEHIIKLLGKKWIEEQIKNLDNNNYEEFIRRMLLDYYDKLYHKSFCEYTYDLKLKSDNMEEIINIFKNYYQNIKN